mgnify:CR=1 FL=1
MKIIVGLGNPGREYENTRHNVGFLMLDKVAGNYKVNFGFEKKFNAELAKIKLESQDIVLVKPQTFMNLSGDSVKGVVDFYKINPSEDLIVIYDDIDVEFSKVRIRSSGSSAGHKGIESIISKLALDSFIRVRIGIGRPPEEMKVEDYVLGKFSKNELAVLDEILDNLVKQGLSYLGS